MVHGTDHSLKTIDSKSQTKNKKNSSMVKLQTK